MLVKELHVLLLDIQKKILNINILDIRAGKRLSSFFLKYYIVFYHCMEMLNNYFIFKTVRL